MPNVENLLKLADALEQEHKGFEWDFNIVSRDTPCGTAGCAIGLAWHLGLYVGGWGMVEGVRKAMGMTDEQVTNVFMNNYELQNFYHADSDNVTPAMVAKELRRIASENKDA